MERNPQIEFGFIDRKDTVLTAEDAPGHSPAISQPDTTRELVRYLVILADDSWIGVADSGAGTTEFLGVSTANVLAHDANEAFFLASEAIEAEEDGHYRPIIALRVENLLTLVDALQGCPLSPVRPVMSTLGGYASLEQLKNSVPADQMREEESKHFTPEITACDGQDRDNHGGNFAPDGMIGYVEVVCFDESDLHPTHAEITRAAWSRFGSSSCIGKTYIGNKGDKDREFTWVRYPVFASLESLWEAARYGDNMFY